MLRKIATWTAAFVLMAGLGEAATQGKGKGRGDQASNTAQVSRASSKDSSFGSDESRIIREWFANPKNLKGLPPGLAKKDQLPPGLQKQLAKNGKLPPGLEKKIQPLPPELEVRLPRLPDGRRRIVIAGNVILLEERTAMVIDIIRDIVKSR